jgi:hypothetical protein
MRQSVGRVLACSVHKAAAVIHIHANSLVATPVLFSPLACCAVALSYLCRRAVVFMPARLQNFKVLKVEPVTYEGDDKYVKVDFKYQLLTGAGFEVDRRGVASLTSQGPAVEALWAASTTQRYKKTEADLRNIVASFRCYASGINLSEELTSYD